MWNKHLQEVAGKLVTTLQVLPIPKRLGVLANVKSRLEIDTPGKIKRMLTSDTREWLLPPGDLQRVPIINHPTQRVKQRVTTTHPAKLLPLQQVTEAPPIMVVPNPTAKQILKVT
jgi:hypothetical protein